MSQKKRLNKLRTTENDKNHLELIADVKQPKLDKKIHRKKLSGSATHGKKDMKSLGVSKR